MKLGDGDALRSRRSRASGLGSATAVSRSCRRSCRCRCCRARTPVSERVDSLLRLAPPILAPFEPAAIVCFTGPGLDRETADRRRGLRDGRARGRARSACGSRVEPFQRGGRSRAGRSLNTLGDAPSSSTRSAATRVGIQFDVWHLWNTPDRARRDPALRAPHRRRPRLATGASRPAAGPIVSCRATERPTSPRSSAPRRRAGWDGLYDLEIFSDNGTFGSAYPDSLWDLDAADLARRGRDAFTHSWSEQEGPGGSRWPERRTMRVSKRARWALVDRRRLRRSSSPRLRRPARIRRRRRTPIVIGWAYDSTGGDGAVRRAGARRGADRGRTRSTRRAVSTAARS